MINYREAAQAIAAGHFEPAYLFCGGEPFLIRELSHLLAGAYLGEEGDYGGERVEGKDFTLSEALERLEGASLFASRKLLMVDEPPYLAVKSKGSARDEEEAEEAGKKSGEKIAGQLEQFIEREKVGKTPTRIILFRTLAVDRRRRLFKLLEKKGSVVDCAPLKGPELSRWIRERLAGRGKNIEPAAIQRLLWSGDNNLYTLANELDKYSSYLGEGEKTITTGVVELLFSGDMQGNIFTLTDALSKGNLDQALQVLSLLSGKREEPLRIFFMLVRHFRLLLSARSLREEKMSPGQHPGALGVHPFEARKLYSQSAAFSCASLEEIIIFLQKIDYQIKTGQAPPQQALESAVAGIHRLSPFGAMSRERPDGRL